MFTSRSKGVHSHIKSLGLNELNEAVESEISIIGQNDARRAAGLIVDMVRSNKYNGRCFVLTGPSGSGKTALTVAISEELGIKIPFVCLSPGEVLSEEVKKSEIIMEFLRRSVLVKFREVKDVYEGEVVNYHDSILDLRSLKGTRSLKLSKELQDQMESQDVKFGDVVHIDSSSGIIKALGRGESHLNDYDLEAEKYVPLPKNDIYKKKELFHETTLHSLDNSLVNPTSQDVISLVHQVVKYKKSEITNKLRREVDDLVIKSGAEVISGILLIEDAHMLDLECFTYLSKAIDSDRCPLIILCSNIKEGQVRGSEKEVGGSEEISPFGIPRSFLDKCLIIPLQRNKNEVEIIKRRLNTENVEIEEEALKALEGVSKERGLIYTINLCKMLRSVEGKVTGKDVEELVFLFESN